MTKKWLVGSVFAGVAGWSAWFGQALAQEAGVSQTLYAQPVPATSTPRTIDESLFKVVDPFTDKAVLPNGNSSVRLHQNPRLTYRENEVLKVRPDGWNLFSETSKSRVRAGVGGYAFAIPFAGSEDILVTPAPIETGARPMPVQASVVTQTRQGTAHLSVVKDVYEGIDVSFLDQAGSRQKFITVKEKPDLSEDNTMVFWEEYKLPAGAQVFDGEGKTIDGEVENAAGEVRVSVRNGESLVLSNAIVYDANLRTPEQVELHADSVAKKIVYDRTANILKIGLKLPASYLLAANRAYPVTIDPFYIICSGSCDTNQVYLRYMTSSNVKQGLSQNYLALGYIYDMGHATRQPLIAFMQGTTNYFPDLGLAQGTLTSARLYLTRSDLSGSGATSGGVVQTEVRQIMTSWSRDTVTYGDPDGSSGIHEHLNPVAGSIATIPFSLADGGQISWTVTPLVQNWIAGQFNYGLYIAPTPHWTAGSVPGWPSRIFQFRSSQFGSGGGPYLQMEFTPPKPNLTDNGTTVNPSTLTFGQSFSATIKVRNASNQATTQSALVRYFFNPSNNCDGAVNQIGTVTVPPLPANGTFSQVISYTPGSTGTFCFQFRIDSDGAIDEAVENDNNFFIPSITVNAGAKPDLTPNSFTLSGQTTYYTGATFSVNAVLQNTGSVVASGVPYKLVLRDAANSNLFDMQCGSSGLNVPANSANTYTFSCVMPASLSKASAAYYVRLQVDPSNVIAENDDANNISESTNTVVVEQLDYNNGPSTPADPNGNTVPLDAKLATINGKAAVAQTLQLQNKNTYKIQNQIKADQVAKNYAADPVNTRTGAFEFSQTDFALSGLGLPIEFTRTYNSKYLDRNVRFGRGWSHSYHMFYYQNPSTQEVQVYLGGALVSYFTPAGDGVNFVAERGDFNTLYKEGNYLVYKTQDGLKYRFSLKLYDSIGTLKEIEDTNGNKTVLGYVDVRGVDLLSTITDPSGRAIRLVYPSDSTGADWDKVKEIRENLGGTDRLVARFTYNVNLDLTQVHYESTYGTESVRNKDHAFTYDANGYMTSYTDPRGVILYNEYDNTGRVIRQYEYNERLDGSNPSAKHLIYELAYNDSPDSGVLNSAHCVMVKNYRTSSNQYFEKSCFNSDELKVYSEKGLNIEKWEYDSNGQPNKYIDAIGHARYYQYDTKRRLVQETVSATEWWRTVIDFEYDNTYNRLLKKTQKVSPFTNPTSVVATKVDTYTIDAKGNLLTHQDPTGAIEKWEYNANGTASKYTDKRNVPVTYVYNSYGNRTHEVRSVNRPDGILHSVTKIIDYDVYSRKVAEYDPRMKITRYEYDTSGNVRKVTDPMGAVKLYDYDGMDNRIQEVDELGHVTDYVLDTDINASLRSVIKRSGTGDIISAREYDYVGNLTKEIDSLNRQVSLVYDTANRVVQKTDPRKTTFYEYDNNGTLRRETTTAGTQTYYLYDERRNKIEERRFYSVNSHFALKWQYDGFDRVTKYTDQNEKVTTFEYDAMDRVIKKTDAAGGVSTYRYDTNGNKTGERTPRAEVDGTLRNADGQSVTQVYDELNRLVKVINADNKETVYLYDQSNNLVKQTDWQNAGGGNATRVTVNEHDNVNRLHKTIFADNSSIGYTYFANGLVKTKKDQMGRVTEYGYDDFNRLTSEKDNAGQITAYAYDKAGNKKTVTYPDNTQVKHDYNNLNKVEKTTDQAGSTHQYVYDALGNLTQETDKNNHVTSYTYNILSRLTGEINAQNTTTTYTYDGNGNRLAQTVAGKLTKFEYDALNRVKKITHPGNRVETATYDVNGNKLTTTNGVGETITHTYDVLDRLGAKIVGAQNTVTHQYDNWGNVVNVSDEGGNTTYTYSVMNRPESEVKTLRNLAGQFTVTKTYYADGQLKTLTDASGKVFTYTYNNRGLLSTVAYGAQNLAAYTYTSFGKPLAITYGNGVVTSHAYDNAQRPTKIETKNATGTVLWSEAYTYDAQSNRLTMTDHTGRTVQYGYDVLDQLTSAKYTINGVESTLSYAYDTAGNRIALNTPLGNTGYSYRASTNEVETITNNTLTIGVQFNGHGSLAKETYTRAGEQTQEISYTFTPENRVRGIEYRSPSGLVNTLAFWYDNAGNRVQKIVNNQDTTYYFNQGLTVLNEISSAGTVTKTIVQGAGPVAEIDSQNVITYVHQDAMGSAALLTNSAGAVVQEYDYDPFGAVIGSDGSVETKYLFTNQEFDPESELYYFNARYYNPALGRFISRDPVMGYDGDMLSRNQYIYVKNNPFRYVDPTGMEAKKVSQQSWSEKLGAGLRYVLGVETTNAPAHESEAVPSKTFWSDNGPAVAIGEWTDASDIAIIFTNKNLNGAPASKVDKTFAYGGAFLPFVSGGVVKKVTVKVGDRVVNMSDHALERANDKWHISFDKVQNTINNGKSFLYNYGGEVRQGFYDAKEQIFVGIGREVTTVTGKVKQNYINNLLKK